MGHVDHDEVLPARRDPVRQGPRLLDREKRVDQDGVALAQDIWLDQYANIELALDRKMHTVTATVGCTHGREWPVTLTRLSAVPTSVHIGVLKSSGDDRSMWILIDDAAIK